jgi:hemoglobin-like flavoprotein
LAPHSWIVINQKDSRHAGDDGICITDVKFTFAGLADWPLSMAAAFEHTDLNTTMTPQQIALVQSTFQFVLPIADQTTALFYARLFELDPSLRHLFNGQMADQRRKLTDMLAFAVSQLERPDLLLPALRDLGARHVNYGVQDAHYATVGSALIWTLRQGLGPTFSRDVEAAWTALYQLISDTMRQRAAKADAA